MNIYKPVRKETIVSIERVMYPIIKGERYFGYEVTTTEQNIRCIISEGMQISERTNALCHCVGNPRGKQLIEIRYGKDDQISGYNTHSVCIELVLHDASVITLTVYNCHDGYYPHTYRIEWKGHLDVDEL